MDRRGRKARPVRKVGPASKERKGMSDRLARQGLRASAVSKALLEPKATPECKGPPARGVNAGCKVQPEPKATPARKVRQAIPARRATRAHQVLLAASV